MADGGNLQLALRITADLRSAVNQLLALQKQIDGVDASAKSAAASNSELAKATDKQASASEAAAANDAKLQRLLVEHEEANRALLESTTELTAADIERNAATDAARASNAAYAASLIDTKGAEAQRTADSAAALRLFAQIDPIGSKLEKVDAYEVELNRLHKTGAVTNDDFLTFGALLQANRSKLLGITEDAGKAGGAVAKLGTISGSTAREVGVIGNEVVNGNFARLDGSLITLANRTGLLPKLFTATGAAIAATAAAAVVLSVAFVEGSEEDSRFATLIETTGNSLGVTTGQLRDMARGMVDGRTSIGRAEEALIQVAQTGRFTGSQIGLVTRAVIDMANTTGVSIDKAVQDYERLADEPVKAVAELNRQYHFLTDATYEHIRALVQEGQTQQAGTEAQDAFAQHFATAAAHQLENMGAIERGWDAIKFAAHSAWDAMLDIGRSSTVDDKLDAVTEALVERARLLGQVRYNPKSGINTFEVTPQAAADLNPDALKKLQDLVARYKSLRAQVDSAGAAATAKQIRQQANDETIALGQEADQFASAEIKRKEQITKAHADANKAVADAVASGNAQLVPKIRAAEDAIVAGINSRGKKPKGGLGIDRAELAADVQAYQNAWQAAERAFANTEHTLAADRKADAIDDKAYFQAKQDNIAALLDAQLKALQAERDALPAHANTAAEKIRIDAQVGAIDARIEQAKQDAAAKTQALQDQQLDTARQRAGEWSALQQSYFEATGQSGKAELLRLQEAFDKAMTQMLEASNVDGQILAANLFDVGKAKVKLDQIQQAVRVSDDAIALQTDAIQANINAGLIPEIDGRQQIIDLHKQTIAALEAEIPAAEQLAALTNNPADALAVLRLKEQIREAQLATSAWSQEIGGVLSSSWDQFLDNITSGTESIKQGFIDFIRSAAAGLAKLELENLTQKAVAGIKGLFGNGASSTADAAVQQAAATASAATLGAGVETGAATAALTLGGGLETGGVAAGTTIAEAMTVAGAEVAAQIATAMAAGGAGGSGASGLVGLLSLFGGSSEAAGSGIEGAASLVGDGFMAAGGLVTGPGTETSDSILVRLSTGEHVTKAAAVRHYGVGMMAAINERRFPRFADGGFVGMAPALRGRLVDNTAMKATLQNHMRVYLLQNEDELAQRIAQHPANEKAIIAVAGDNGTAIRARW